MKNKLFLISAEMITSQEPNYIKIKKQEFSILSEHREFFVIKFINSTTGRIRRHRVYKQYVNVLNLMSNFCVDARYWCFEEDVLDAEGKVYTHCNNWLTKKTEETLKLYKKFVHMDIR